MVLTIDGRRIGYDDSGGHGIPVVLLHGFPFDRTSWDPVMDGLGGIRAIRIDLRGCGESARSDGPALMEMLAGDVAGVLDALHVERAAVAGTSMGGYVALAFFRMYAERVAGLALVASHASADARGGDAGGAQSALAASRAEIAARLERDGTMDAAIERYLPRAFAPEVYAERPHLVEQARAHMARQDPAGCAQLIRGMAERVDAHELLEDIDVPALVVACGRDAYLDARDLEATARAIRGAHFVPIEEAGHTPHWESPLRTADALNGFARRVRA